MIMNIIMTVINKYIVQFSSPYLIMQISPTTSSTMLISWIRPPLKTVTLCESSILFFNPLNCFSFFQSFIAVTKTTTATAPRIAKPSIHDASEASSSSNDESK